MQLLKMENDKLPKEICTYKIRKTYILEGIYSIQHYQNNKVTNISFLIVHELSYYNYEKCIFNNLIYIYQKILINMLEHFNKLPSEHRPIAISAKILAL